MIGAFALSPTEVGIMDWLTVLAELAILAFLAGVVWLFLKLFK